MIVNNVLEGNGADGVLVQDAPGVVVGNYAAVNAQNGLNVLGVTLANAIYGNFGDGIDMGAGVALGNHSNANLGTGIVLSPDVGSAFNVAESNVGAPAVQIEPGVELGQNLCSGTLTCPAP